MWFVSSCKANFESKKGGSDPEPKGPEGVATALFTFFAASPFAFRGFLSFCFELP